MPHAEVRNTQLSVPPFYKRARKLTKSGTIAAYTRSLIMKGTISDEDIVEKVRKKFPHAKISSNVVWHYRAQLQAYGVDTPEPIME